MNGEDRMITLAAGCMLALFAYGVYLTIKHPLPKVEAPQLVPTFTLQFDELEDEDPVVVELEELFWSPAYGEHLA